MKERSCHGRKVLYAPYKQAELNKSKIKRL